MKKKLGKGLQALIPEIKTPSKEVQKVKIEEIKPSPYQPRLKTDEKRILELMNSIREKGILQPLIVRKKETGFELVAGHRRYEAAKRLNLKEVPVITKELTDKEVLEISLIENLHRENLNPIEEAKAFKRLIEEFNYTLEDIAHFLSKDKSTISNTLRLLKLPSIIQKSLEENKITPGHARALLSCEDPKKQIIIFEKILNENLSVRETENLVQKESLTKTKKFKKDFKILAYEDELRKDLGIKVKITQSKKNIKVILEFCDKEELERFIRKIKNAIF